MWYSMHRLHPKAHAGTPNAKVLLSPERLLECDSHLESARGLRICREMLLKGSQVCAKKNASSFPLGEMSQMRACVRVEGETREAAARA